MKMGRDFENKIQNSLRRHGYVHKFRDYAVNPKGAYKVPVPSDFLFLRNGKAYFIECKEYKGGRFQFSRIRKVQLDSIKQITDAGGIYIFLIHNKELNRIYIIEGMQLLKHVQIQKSMSVTELNMYAYVEMQGRYSRELIKKVEEASS